MSSSEAVCLVYSVRAPNLEISRKAKVTEPHGSSGLSLPRLRLQAQATTLDFSWVLGVQTQLLVPHGKHFMISLAFCLLVQGNAELSELWSPECTILSSVRHKTASSS